MLCINDVDGAPLYGQLTDAVVSPSRNHPWGTSSKDDNHIAQIMELMSEMPKTICMLEDMGSH